MRNFRPYGSQHYAQVIGHGYEFQDAARRVAPGFPRTVYPITSAAVADSPNVAGIRFAFEEPSYLAGILAGSMTKTNVIGCIGGTELPPVKTSFAAFARGARAANSQVRVITSYIGNWDDVSTGREHAIAQIARAADIIVQNADAAGLGIFQAARQSRRALIISSNANQNDIAPEVTLGSVVTDLPHAFLLVAREVREGRFKPRVFEFGAATDVVKLVLNPRREPEIPASVRYAINSLAAALKAGAFSPQRETSTK